MRDHSSMMTVEFVFSVMWKYMIGFIWYKNLLFRTLPHHSVQESLNNLMIMSCVSIAIYLILFQHWKNGWTSTGCFVIPFGIYTSISYATTFPGFIRGVTVVLSFIVIVYTLFLLTRKVKNKQRKILVKIYKNRVIKCMHSASCIVTVAMLFLIVGIGYKGYFGTGLVSSSVEAAATNSEKEEIDTLEINMKTVVKLIPAEWKKLSTHEKIDVLQVVCNIEAHYLGLCDPITVQGDNLLPYTLGEYSDGLKLIRINLDHIENDPIEEVLSTLFHEIHHGYEYRLADVYTNLEPEYQELRLFKDATYYSQEVRNYINPRKDYYGYINQHLEMDSETYAEYGIKEYYTRICTWVNDNNLPYDISDLYMDK